MELTVTQFLNAAKERCIIDVRSPSEFNKGHIPEAYNIPLFSDEERALVGTTYKQKGKEEAINLGWKIVRPKLAKITQQSLLVAPEKRALINCWRGGMRSNKFAWHLKDSGFNDVGVLQKGYKAYRNHVLHLFSKPLKLIVLGGYTGSGKTAVLNELRKLGEQVIDLEALANHKGSAFGAIGQESQPTVEHFENTLADKIQKLNSNERIWIEDESRNIGSVQIPNALFVQIRNANVVFIEVSKPVRADRLVKDYANIDNEMLVESVQKIRKRLGHNHAQRALELLAADNHLEVANIALTYYDKAYNRGVSFRNQNKVFRLQTISSDSKETAHSVLAFVETNPLFNELIKTDSINAI